MGRLKMDRRLIINADDFGLCEGVNRGIVQAHKDGVLTSATIMVSMPSADEAVEAARSLSGLGVGVHLNLTEGRPVSEDVSVRCLLDSNGCFAYSPSKLALMSVFGKVKRAIRAEFAAQIQWFIDRGIRPTHLDSHKHIHCFPTLFTIVCELAGQFDVSAVRFAFEPGWISRKPWPAPGDNGPKRARKVRFMARINRLQNRSLLKTDALLGVAHTGKIDVGFFEAVVRDKRILTAEVMTHPGYIDGLNPAKTRLVEQRKKELDALCSEKTRQYIEEAGIKLVHYGQL